MNVDLRVESVGSADLGEGLGSADLGEGLGSVDLGEGLGSVDLGFRGFHRRGLGVRYLQPDACTSRRIHPTALIHPATPPVEYKRAYQQEPSRRQSRCAPLAGMHNALSSLPRQSSSCLLLAASSSSAQGSLVAAARDHPDGGGVMDRRCKRGMRSTRSAPRCSSKI